MPADSSSLLLFAVVILFAITIHEFAHAWTANWLGDPTARMEGRITLNPIVHLDLLGVLCFIFAGFGWGKPVPVNPYNLRHPLRDDMLISASGPISNIIAAFAFGLIVRVVGFQPDAHSLQGIIFKLAYTGVKINLILAIFNLIPLHPLDGSHVLRGLLPRRLVPSYDSYCQAGPMLLLGLILLGQLGGVHVLSAIISPPVRFLGRLFTGFYVFL